MFSRLRHEAVMLPRSLLAGLMLFAAWPCYAEWNYSTVLGDGDVPLNVVSAGNPDRPAILFIHGLGQSHYSFVHQLESELANDFYLVAFDLRGHGESGKPWNKDAYSDYGVWARDVAAVIEATGARQPTVVAWSYGGFVLMDYIREFGTSGLEAVNFTGSLGGLVPFRMPASDDPLAGEFARMRQLQSSPDFVDKLEAADGVVNWLAGGDIAEPYRQLFISIGFMLPSYARQHLMAHPLDNQDLLAGLKLPVMLSMGSKDNAAMLVDAKALSAQRANVSLSTFSGAGHMAFFEQSQRFNAELREFVLRSKATQSTSVNSPAIGQRKN